MLKFGESTRTYVFTGPSELMPEEGPSREHKKQAALLEAIKSRKEKEAAIAKAQMAKALTGGVSWGMDDDGNAVDEDQDDCKFFIISGVLVGGGIFSFITVIWLYTIFSLQLLIFNEYIIAI